MQNPAGLGRARQCTATQGGAWHGQAGHGAVPGGWQAPRFEPSAPTQGEDRHGGAMRGLAGRGVARHGDARRGMARQGARGARVAHIQVRVLDARAWQGSGWTRQRLGWALRGVARPGKEKYGARLADTGVQVPGAHATGLGLASPG